MPVTFSVVLARREAVLFSFFISGRNESMLCFSLAVNPKEERMLVVDRDLRVDSLHEAIDMAHLNVAMQSCVNLNHLILLK